MARRKTHTDKWWDAAPPHIIRCGAHNKTDGSRCRAEAHPGTTVCDRHGALIPAVQSAAARRIQMSVDEAAKQLVDWMGDPGVDMRERVKIAHDLLDRGGLAATQKHLVGTVQLDPVEQLFHDILTDPNGLTDANAVQVKALPAPDPQQAAIDRAEAGGPVHEDIVDAEIVEPEPERISARPPKHLLDDLKRAGLW